MRRRLVLLAVSVAGIGLAAYLSRRSPAADSPCPPGLPCEDPTPVWPVLGPILGGLIAFAVVLAIAVQPRGAQPAFVPDPRSLRVALGLGLAAALLFALSLDLPVLLGYVAFGAVFAAFLLGGAAMRPRGSRLRGLMVGVTAYLVAGVVSVLIMNRGFVGDMDLLAWAVQSLAWPGLWYLALGGFLG